MSPHPQDAALLQRVQEGDGQAFEQLYLHYWEPLYLFALKRLQCAADAKDIVQDIFISLWERREQLAVHTSLAAYLHTAVHYKVLARISSLLNDKKKAARLAPVLLAGFTAARDTLHEKEVASAMAGKINLLPEKMRQVYLLSREEKLSLSEIAHQLNLSEQTIKNQLTTALSRLRSGLKEVLHLLLIIW